MSAAARLRDALDGIHQSMLPEGRKKLLEFKAVQLALGAEASGDTACVLSEHESMLQLVSSASGSSKAGACVQWLRDHGHEGLGRRLRAACRRRGAVAHPDPGLQAELRAALQAPRSERVEPKLASDEGLSSSSSRRDLGEAPVGQQQLLLQRGLVTPSTAAPPSLQFSPAVLQEVEEADLPGVSSAPAWARLSAPPPVVLGGSGTEEARDLWRPGWRNDEGGGGEVVACATVHEKAGPKTPEPLTHRDRALLARAQAMLDEQWPENLVQGGLSGKGHG